MTLPHHSSELGTKKCKDAEKKGVEVVPEEWIRSQVDGGSSSGGSATQKKKQDICKDPSTSVGATAAKKAVPVSFNIESYFNAKKEEIDVYLVGNTKKNKSRFLRFMGGTYIIVFDGKISKPHCGEAVEQDDFDSIEEAKAHVTKKVLDAITNKGYDLSTSPDASSEWNDDEEESESEDEDTKFNKQMGEYNSRAFSAEKKGHGAYIKFQREHLGITTFAMAKKLKTTKGSIEKLESGVDSSASDDIIEELDNQFSTIFALKKEKGWM
jgi:DNA-binding transcriptional regulator YiaG